MADNLEAAPPVGDRSSAGALATGLRLHEDEEVEGMIVFDDAAEAVRAFVGAGPTALAVGHSGEAAVGQAVREGLGPFAGTDGRATLPTSYRVMLARV
jgi:hypothetical protein